MVHDIDIFKLCRSILWHENDARVLLETMRLLSSFYSHGMTSSTEDQKGTNGLIFLLKPTNDILPSVIHQITVITTNTLHTELLLSSLQLLAHITQFLCHLGDNDITENPAMTNDDADTEIKRVMALALALMKQYQVEKLIDWGLDRLEEQSRGVGIGMGLNRSIAIHVMYLLWLFFHHDLVALDNDPGRAIRPNDDILTRRLKPSMQAIVEYIQQEDEFDKSSDDKEIEQLAEALGQFTII
ncbi:hypothetical protein BCR42DRAFT_199439 [Absidia repens]|uniref:Uncharacterized protein n=1 Tax=Absidia repens TaxID=90262 RepID=A0A1X2HX41_9FUNG|nr:hypothetical protein BCR42DRAFT_199439 [Absidia repens]